MNARVVFAFYLLLPLVGSPKPEQAVNLKYQNTSVRVVLADLFRQAHARFRLVDVEPAKITTNLTGVSVSTALHSVLIVAQSHGRQLTYEVKNGVYMIHPVPAVKAKKGAKRMG